tara:strand:- start:2 stop:1441 length:1440 start_codon:yes stop_codon:yes gene_type:complete
MADSPKEAEAAQALFCAVVDYEGKKITPIPEDFSAFKVKYGTVMNKVRRKVITPGVSYQRIERLLSVGSNKWYDSSVNIANKLFDDTKRLARKTHNRIRPKGIDLFYVRGDNNVMGSLDTIFKHVRTQVTQRNRQEGINDLNFKNINKWSPADIYLASADGQRILKRLASGRPLSTPIRIGKTPISSLSSFVSFGVFNAVIRRMIIKGDILPLSLKKAPNKDSVVIKTINFLPGDVTRALEASDVKYHGYIFSNTNDVYNSKDVYLKITNKHRMQFRDKGQTGGGLSPKFSYQGIITGGAQALDGSLGGGAIGAVLYQTSPQLGRHFSEQSQKNIISAAQKISSDMFHDMEVDGVLDRSINNTICNKVYAYAKKYTNLQLGSKLEFYTNLYNHPGYGRQGTGITRREAGEPVSIQNATLTQRAITQFLFGKFMGGRLIEGMETATGSKANEMTTNLVLYAGSRTRSSSPHFKASDVSSF